MTLGERLRDLRRNHPDGYIKQRDMAGRVGVSWPQWSHFEANRERPDRDLLARRICPILGGDLGELLRLWEEWTEAPPLDMSGNICQKRWLP